MIRESGPKKIVVIRPYRKYIFRVWSSMGIWYSSKASSSEAIRGLDEREAILGGTLGSSTFSGTESVVGFVVTSAMMAYSWNFGWDGEY